jgi:hypothetical protein
MSEILTESFCERCGTRYTFESARPKLRLKGVRVLSRGLKNFVLSDDTTMDEAMASARSEADREVTSHQLDAFHKTFNFCMSCRQYTCPNCWNEVEARCLSCAPLALPELAPTSFPSRSALTETLVAAELATNGANGDYHDAISNDEMAAVMEPEASAAQTAADEALPTDAITAELVVEETVAAEPAAKATSQTTSLLNRFRPGQSLDDELAEFERERSGAEAHEDEAAIPAAIEAPAAEAPTAAAEMLPIEAVAAEERTEPSAGAVEPDLVMAVETDAEPTAAAAADVVEQPTWRITAPDAEAPAVGSPAQSDTTIPLQATEAPLPPTEPQWPTKPEWPAPQASIGLPFLGRPVQPQGGVESLWAASNRELVTAPPAPGRSVGGIQPCISCGLSLSATARFCRRCGTLQGG